MRYPVVMLKINISLNAQAVPPESPVWELNGDQYELFPLPPGPARMFRAMLGQSDPAPAIVQQQPDALGPVGQYEIFPELGAAFRLKSPDEVDDSVLLKLQDVLNPPADTLGQILEAAEAEAGVSQPVRQQVVFDDPAAAQPGGRE